ncbi:hypothetical protein PVAP13_1NG409857 [Panicum virgatum]|uniref:CCHC-type domain-containing protein n=1 Tax=Panicum virgatum TaxID=38727 RepID=A0A8T0WW41_PANVG|nr:hypothetical protein PVAP13_1NG409857 [Panicum virgatum]
MTCWIAGAATLLLILFHQRSDRTNRPERMSEPPSPRRTPSSQPSSDCFGAGGHPSPRASNSSLNPNAPPFSPPSGAGPSRRFSGTLEGICFSIPSDFEDEDEDLLVPPPRPSSKGKEPMPSRHAAGGFMADAHRQPPRGEAPPPPPRLRSTPFVDADGFQLVVSKRNLRCLRSGFCRVQPPPPRRPVPADLVGRCSNCLSFGHVAPKCSFPSRCLRCEREGHSARNCKHSRSGPPPRAHGQSVRSIVACRDSVAAALFGCPGRSAASASAISSGSTSSGRPHSGPPSICRPSPVPSLGGTWSPSPSAPLPRGHPSRRLAFAIRTIPRFREHSCSHPWPRCSVFHRLGGSACPPASGGGGASRGFREHSRSRPWPRRTVFHRLGKSTCPSASGGGGGASRIPADSTMHVERRSEGGPRSSNLGWSLASPLRFGQRSSACAPRHPPAAGQCDDPSLLALLTPCPA